ncbi:uncharacterized protein TM35_000261310, partial [Trypanosoma theileri]
VKPMLQEASLAAHTLPASMETSQVQQIFTHDVMGEDSLAVPNTQDSLRMHATPFNERNRLYSNKSTDENIHNPYTLPWKRFSLTKDIYMSNSRPTSASISSIGVESKGYIQSHLTRIMIPEKQNVDSTTESAATEPEV